MEDPDRVRKKGGPHAGNKRYEPGKLMSGESLCTGSLTAANEKVSGLIKGRKILNQKRHRKARRG